MITANDLRESPEPLYKRLAEAILAKIAKGEIAPGARLPAIRAQAAALRVNNATVVAAYKLLEKKRAVLSKRGSGVYVSPVSPPAPQPPVHDFSDYINFAATAISTEFFPTEDFRQAFDTVLARDGAGAFSQPGDGGYLPLRGEISARLANLGIDATAEEISIVPGLREGLLQILSAKISPGDSVVLESPCAPWAAAAFAFFGANIHELPITKKGPDLVRLANLVKKFRPKIFFLSPNFQFPTGLCYTDSERKKVLALACDAKAYIIEADDCGDFFYDARQAPLKAEDADGRVVYLSSFERTIAPGFPGYAVGNIETGCEVPGFLQRGLHCYLQSGNYDGHLAKLRGVFAKRYRCMMAAAETFLSPYANFIRPGGGLGLWVSPKKPVDPDEFLARKVIVSPGRFYAPGAPAKHLANHDGHFRISFAGVGEECITRGIGIIASLLQGGERQC